MIAGPVFLVFVVMIIVVFVFHHHQRVYHNRQRLDMEDPSCEMCLSKDKTLQDLVYDLSTSGSGSGIATCRGDQKDLAVVSLGWWLPQLCHSSEAAASEPVQGVCHD